ncbi:Hypothetical predicted protein [Mytilus galloprovincialis]|uniref:Uncharacterized protein n=1 Tax=Mytilus galloprovincialis TaxID=29158 RepID=A0A8B6FQT7_MYTGA|nr:Hypothetical predicted protein [Mytilus galloprovincialis]
MLVSICPGDGDNLFELIIPSAEREDNVLDEATQEAYNLTETWALQRQLLSMLAVKKFYNYANHLIPGVTRYRYNVAKKHGMKYGVGAPMSSISNFRKTIDPARAESFIDFITYSNIIQDMPFDNYGHEESFKENGDYAMLHKLIVFHCSKKSAGKSVK